MLASPALLLAHSDELCNRYRSLDLAPGTHIQLLNADLLAANDGLDVRFARGGGDALVLQGIQLLEDLVYACVSML